MKDTIESLFKHLNHKIQMSEEGKCMNKNNYISSDAVLINNILGNNLRIYKNAEVKNSRLDDYVLIGDEAIVVKSYLESNSEINRRNWIVGSKIGSYTYTGLGTSILYAEIGSFCSISWNVSIGGANHDYNKVTTSRLTRYYSMDTGKPVNNNDDDYLEPCVIGNDVWIASNVVILRGVKIGNGAVIGASSVVTKDVEPYSIVVGVPARVIKKRFDDNTISVLEKIQWWNWPKDIIRVNLDLIYSSTVDDTVINKLVDISKNIK